MALFVFLFAPNLKSTTADRANEAPPFHGFDQSDTTTLSL